MGLASIWKAEATGEAHFVTPFQILAKRGVRKMNKTDGKEIIPIKKDEKANESCPSLASFLLKPSISRETH